MKDQTMSKEKQIEEMAREICHLSKECETCQICDERYPSEGEHCYFQCVAKEIIKHGYRKQSEGEWTYSENKKTMECTMCRLRMKTYDVRRYCPNCGAKMRKEDEGE